MPRRTASPAGPARRRAALPAAALAAALLLLALAPPAHAAGYRYWSYWLRSGTSWTYAQTGPAMHVPADGSVEGWRFAVSKDAAAKAVQPRGTADFAAICAHTPAAAGRKRIALVIDPGTSADAAGHATPPPARTACAQVPTAASSADALASVAKPLRYNSAGVLCAITGYPAAGCGDEVGSTASAPAAHHSGPSLGLLAGTAAVAVLALAAAWQFRRRR
ncbi:SCO2322 family protein [Streptomyces sp. NPDC020983]|uniref:SCO2322 family protein n=1 Tax=Streptomyces sp. NPDC020983 TaxID=3365106 RepID=UPI0037B94B18